MEQVIKQRQPKRKNDVCMYHFRFITHIPRYRDGFCHLVVSAVSLYSVSVVRLSRLHQGLSRQGGEVRG